MDEPEALVAEFDSGHDYRHYNDGKRRPTGEYTFMEAVTLMRNGYLMKSAYNGNEYFVSYGSGRFEGGDIVVQSIEGKWRAIPWRMM